uniref:SIR2-like domain-containing protein n=1 Tax=Candidatus Kentrum sp. TUN TaxID=2126343 RepID=A0A451A8M0_9GAMM|nr:MAG: SIR2-like domain-containing protein [Candidatus Kentron sp. TUN]
MLKEYYSITDVSDDHVDICHVNWRRFYTTNYDKAIEIASLKVNKVIECVDLSFRTDEYYKREALCIHLNGSIDSLTEESLGDGFKLSNSSYISTDSFLSSPWYYYFKKDLERSSAIVFIGYSMYDFEIQKILFENSSFKEKTYFITEKNPDEKTRFTLSKFGKVLPIGMAGFSNLIKKEKHLFKREEDEYNMQAFSLCEVSDSSAKIRDRDIEKMLMYGDIDKDFIDEAVVGEQRIPYLVIREMLNKAFEFIRNKQNIVVLAELGNGKTIFLRELEPYLLVNSIAVYSLIDEDGDYIGDIDHISKIGKPAVIILDSYERYLDLIEHYCKSLPENISIIAATRTSEHEQIRIKLKEIGFSFNEIDVDFLMSKESSQFVKIIDNMGLWGKKAGLSHDRKISLLEDDNKFQISLALLSLLEAPQIKNRISSLLPSLFRKQEYKDTIFAISLLEFLDLTTRFSLISDVARNYGIYESELLHNKNFMELFRLSRDRVLPKSSPFCLSLIRNHFSATYVMDQLQKIAERFNHYRHKDFEQDRLFKSTLKFSFVERLLPETNKKNNIRRYYEDLKTSVDWLKYDPHYWVQYAMANITFKDYSKAQGFLDQAYALAKKKWNYYTSNIDTQQARLFILSSINDPNNIVFDNFKKAHRLLAGLDNDTYKFRQVQKYRDYFETCYGKLSKGNKTYFEFACKNMIQDIEKAENSGEIDVNKQKHIGKAKDNLTWVLMQLQTKRK